MPDGEQVAPAVQMLNSAIQQLQALREVTPAVQGVITLLDGELRAEVEFLVTLDNRD